MWSLADRLKKLERELGLAAAPSPFAIDPKAICRRVERTLSAEETERRSYMRHKLRLAAALTAAAVALTGTALAAGPTLLQTALGAFAPYAQNQEGVVEAEGIQVKVLSALTDDLCAKVYLEVTDLTGDRLKNASIAGRLELTLEGETSWSEGCRIVDYDSETKTALVCVERNAGVFLQERIESTVILSDLQPEYHRFSSQPLPVEAIPDRLLRTQRLDTGESVLIPGQNPLELAEGDGVSISSMGFGDDGRLHFLSVFPQGAMDKGHAILTVYSRMPAENGGTFFQKDLQDARFVDDGRVYYDFSLSATLSDRENIDSITGVYGIYTTSDPVEASWELPVTLRPVETVTSPLSGLIDSNTLEELRLSPLGVVLTSSSPNYTQIGGYPLTVFLKDGASFHPESGIHGHQKDGPNMARWVFDRPLEVSDITGVALGCWMIPVENGVAGEGYWLPALPE